MSSGLFWGLLVVVALVGSVGWVVVAGASEHPVETDRRAVIAGAVILFVFWLGIGAVVKGL